MIIKFILTFSLVRLLFSVFEVDVRIPPDIKPYHLQLRLSSEFTTYHPKDIIQLNLTFKNTDNSTHHVILPGEQNKGKKMVFLSYYTVDENNHYTEVARESRQVTMDTSNFGQTYIKTLEAGDSVATPIFLNDTANYSHHIQAHHTLPDLPPGKYQVLAWYDPMDQRWAPEFFNEVAGFSKNDSIPQGQRKLNIPEGGLMSNYMTVTILPPEKDRSGLYRSTGCTEACHYCQAIENGRWSKVERIIDRQTYYKGEGNERPILADWHNENHCNVAFVFPGPDAILSSLPTYTSRRVIFRNEGGYHYFYASWQLGKIYFLRSRLRGVLDCLAPGLFAFSTSEVDYQKLVGFERY